MTEPQTDSWLHRFHTGSRSVTGIGATDTAGGSWTARLFGRIAGPIVGLPSSSPDQVARVHIVRRVEGDVVHERWIRTLGGRVLITTQTRTGDRVRERFGPLELRMRIRTAEADVWFDPTGAALVVGRFRIRLPAVLAPAAEAHACSIDDEAFNVTVSVRLPLIGTVLNYRGWLQDAAQ